MRSSRASIADCDTVEMQRVFTRLCVTQRTERSRVSPSCSSSNSRWFDLTGLSETETKGNRRKMIPAAAGIVTPVATGVTGALNTFLLVAFLLEVASLLFRLLHRLTNWTASWQSLSLGRRCLLPNTTSVCNKCGVYRSSSRRESTTWIRRQGRRKRPRWVCSMR